MTSLIYIFQCYERRDVEGHLSFQVFFGRRKNATGVIDVIDRGEVTRSNLSAEFGRRMKTAFHH